MPTIIILFFLLSIVSFFFSLSETSVIGLSRIRLRHMIARGVKGAEVVQGLVTKLDKFIAAILIGNNFVNIAMSAIITAICVQAFGYRWGVVLATFISAFFILIFCEITPKILATKHTERSAVFIAPFMESVIHIFAPVIPFFMGVSNLLLKILRIERHKRSVFVTEEELRTMIEVGKEEGVLSEEERKMLHRIFEFGDTEVADVMAPKDKIVAVDIKATSEQLLEIFVEEGHARLPVYQGSLDTVVGVIYARDLLYILRDKKLFLLQDILHKAYFAPARMKVNELLKEFQSHKIQMAVVVDEKKRTLGVVTLEDLIEEIVGEIEEDKHK